MGHLFTSPKVQRTSQKGGGPTKGETSSKETFFLDVTYLLHHDELTIDMVTYTSVRIININISSQMDYWQLMVGQGVHCH